MDHARVDVVIVGGGQAGLGTAYQLVEAGLDVVVLERGRVGETWRSQRWDHFCLNTPNWMNGLPGAPYDGPDPFGFMTHLELAASFDAYVERFALPVRAGVEVTDVSPYGADGRYLVAGQSGEGGSVSYVADSVVVASGILRSPRIPPASARVPDSVLQLHAGNYRSADVLPVGAVVVVGGGQSGAQIVEDLVSAGRTVYFSISKVARFPRSYRGRDFMDWWLDMGMWDLATADVDDPAVLRATNPVVSGVGPRGHTISYQQLARDGVHLMGRLSDVRDGNLITDDLVAEYVRNADERSKGLRDSIDAFIDEHGLVAPAPGPDPADDPLRPDETLDFLTRLDLGDAGVGTIVWSTGFTADFSWIDLPVLDEQGSPVHHGGVSDVPGLYFMGFPWLSKRRSGIIFGIEEDARNVAAAIIRERRAP